MNKKTITTILCMSILFASLSSPTYAGRLKKRFTWLEQEVLELQLERLSELKWCHDIIGSAAPGDRCKTTKGYAFKRIQNGWSDELGKTWLDDIKSHVNQVQAAAYCSKNRFILPSKEDYQLAIRHGFAEVYPDTVETSFYVEGNKYWTSSTYYNGDDFAYVYRPRLKKNKNQIN